MMLLALLLAIPCVLGLVDAQYHAEQSEKHCREPSVRREWRALSKEERADWISAVNVRFSA